MNTDLIRDWLSPQNINVSSSKWAERKDAFTALRFLLSCGKDVQFRKEYTVVYDVLKKGCLDVNINVSTEAIKAAKASIDYFGMNSIQLSLTLGPVLLEKLKEKRIQIREPLMKCLESLIDLEALKKPNVDQKIGINSAIYYGFALERSFPAQIIKKLGGDIVKMTTDADPKVRDSSLKALGGLGRLLSAGKTMQSIMNDLSDSPIKDITKKLVKIDEYQIQANALAVELYTKKNKKKQERNDQAEIEDAGSVEERDGTAEIGESDPWNSLPAETITSQLSTTFFDHLTSKKWAERRDSLESLITILRTTPKLDPNVVLYNKLMGELKEIVAKDTNTAVVTSALLALRLLSSGLRNNFASFWKGIGPHAVMRLKEKKVRDLVASLMDEVFNWIRVESSEELISNGLKSANPQVKTECGLFLHRYINQHSADTCHIGMVKPFVPQLLKLTADSDEKVRDASLAALGSIARCVGYEEAKKSVFGTLCDDTLKMKKLQAFHKSAVEVYGERAAPYIKNLYAPKRTTTQHIGHLENGTKHVSPPTSPSNGQVRSPRTTTYVIRRNASPVTSAASSPSTLTYVIRRNASPVTSTASTGPSIVDKNFVDTTSSHTSNKSTIVVKRPGREATAMISSGTSTIAVRRISDPATSLTVGSASSTIIVHAPTVSTASSDTSAHIAEGKRPPVSRYRPDRPAAAKSAEINVATRAKPTGPRYRPGPPASYRRPANHSESMKTNAEAIPAPKPVTIAPPSVTVGTARPAPTVRNRPTAPTPAVVQPNIVARPLHTQVRNDEHLTSPGQARSTSAIPLPQRARSDLGRSMTPTPRSATSSRIPSVVNSGSRRAVHKE
ncbi:hypothetical protein L596_002129 [Steinernema carpocapsae]|uniref:TOG domain-containing protein n=1 Tax=Steinernema carpocapsae TaxID=34508 RepID=A0A4U8UNA6_STECR|nr:hypothetical protein L596_002129 [Steinernema carpocapsae]